MKLLLCITALFFITVYAFISCKKDDTGPATTRPVMSLLNSPPLARAGADTTITLTSCGEVIYFYLYGGASADPEGKALRYIWTKLSGPDNVQIQSRYLMRTLVQNVVPGEYAFELQVTDPDGLAAKDTVLVSVKGAVKEYDLDLKASGKLTFSDNFLDYYSCYYYGYGACTYYDITNIQADGNFNPLGNFVVNFSESADTAATKYASQSTVQIYQNNVNHISLLGTSTVNLKKLYQQGGGAFEGTVTISDGSARRCQESIFNNHPPLKISGLMDTTAKRVTLAISGKTYF